MRYTNIVAQTGLNRVSGVQFEDRLNLFGSQAVQIGNSSARKVSDSLNKCFAGDALIDRPAIGADIVDQAQKNLFDRLPGEHIKVQGPKRRAGTTRGHIRQKSQQATAGTARRTHPGGCGTSSPGGGADIVGHRSAETPPIAST